MGSHEREQTHKTSHPEVKLDEPKKELDHRRHDRAGDDLDNMCKKQDKTHKERDGLRSGVEDEIKLSMKRQEELLEKLQKLDRVSEKKHCELRKDYDAALAYIEQQKLDISELTAYISRSTKINSTTTRGDDYFEMEFASLEGAIRQWTLRCRGVLNLQHQDLKPTVQDSLKATIFSYSTLSDSKVSHKEIGAAIVERLRACVFCPEFVLTVEGHYHNIYHMSEALGGTGEPF